jgi:MFS-type transporter involved in bile tolerance (Atg22 family)
MSLSFNAILLLNLANKLHQKYHIPKHYVSLWWHIAKLPMVLPYPITYRINKSAISMVTRVVDVVYQWRATHATCSINTVARGAVGVKHKLAFAG